MSSTANDLVSDSLRLIGVIGQGRRTLTANELSDGISTLNDMMESFSIDRRMIYQMLEETKTLTVGVGNYSIGSGGDINTTRPTRIENAFIRDSSNQDFHLEPINNAQYDAVRLKTVQSRPQYFFYDEIFPLAYIRLLYVPSEADTLHINSWKQLQTFSTAATAISLPLGYKAMILYNLAEWLFPFYKRGQNLPKSIKELAISTKAAVMKINSDTPHLSVSDPIMTQSGRGSGNIYTG